VTFGSGKNALHARRSINLGDGKAWDPELQKAVSASRSYLKRASNLWNKQFNRLNHAVGKPREALKPLAHTVMKAQIFVAGTVRLS
jgi:hypothetical protein